MVPSFFKRLIFFVFPLLTSGYVGMSQTVENIRKVVQIAGVVMDNENLQPIPYVNIAVKGTYRGTAADGRGFFSLVTYAGDSLTFSSISFRPVTVKVPDTITTDRYTIYQSLQRDTMELPVTVIYPWPTKEKFREAFLNLNIPDDDFEIARKNVMLSQLKDRARYSKMDAGMNYKHFIQQRTDQLYYAGQQMPNNLLNPFAWAQFLRIWNQQKDDKKRQQKVRNWDSYEP
jgi:hypothetical protein